MDDLSILTNAPSEVTLDGVTFRVGPLKIRELGLVQQWIRDRVPHPVEAIKPHLDGLAPEVQVQLLENARREARDWPPRVGSEEAARHLGTPEGERELLYVILAKYQPAFTRDQAAELYGRLDLADFNRLLAVAFGRGPDEGDPGPGGDAAPKRPAPASRSRGARSSSR